METNLISKMGDFWNANDKNTVFRLVPITHYNYRMIEVAALYMCLFRASHVHDHSLKVVQDVKLFH